MVNGRMGSFSRWTWCALAAVFGLVLAQCAHAQAVGDFPNRSAASAACSSAEAIWLARGPYGGGSFVPCVISSCSEFSESSFRLIAGRSLNGAACSQVSDVRNYFQDNSVPYSSNPGSGGGDFRFSFLEDDEPDQCSELSAFDSAAMGPAGGAGGERVVCYQDCVWDIFGGFYVGTYPSGYVYFTFEPLGYACTDEPEPGDPADGDDDPLDLPPEDGGVDPGPDPGDGSGNSSGGGTCSQSPACTGDSIQCNILFQTWATRCAVQDMGDLFPEDLELEVDFSGVEDGLSDVVSTLDSGFDNLSDGISDVEQELGGIRGFLQNVFGSGTDVSGPIPGLGGLNTGDKVFDENSLDSSGFGMTRSCPAILTNPISFSFFGNQYNINFDLMCDLLELVGQILVVLSAFVGVRILLRSVQ